MSPAVLLRNRLTTETDPWVLRICAHDSRAMIARKAQDRLRRLGIPLEAPPDILKEALVTTWAATAKPSSADLERYWLPDGIDPAARSTCTRCGAEGPTVVVFGYRRMTSNGKIRSQPQCRACRAGRK